MPKSRLYRLWKWLERAILRATLRVRRRDDLRKLGSEYGGCTVPISLLSRSSICYSVGVGEDITWDRALMELVGCEVFAFDPTPVSVEYVKQHASDLPGFHFYDVGLWSRDGTMKFYAPRDPTHVSHSIINLQSTEQFFEARCRRLVTLMKELGHSYIDLLKLDIFGAEYEVLDSMLQDNVLVHVLGVEFGQPVSFLRIRRTVRKLQKAGFTLVSIDGWRYAFVREPWTAPARQPVNVAEGAGR